MDLVLILLPICLVFSGVSVAAFFWAVRSGQFDDLTTPAIRMLYDDPPAPVKRDETTDVTGNVEEPSSI